MEQVKAEFAESVIEEFTHIMREKFKKGNIEHNQSLDEIQNDDELIHELADAVFYTMNRKRVMQKLLDFLEAGDIWEAKELVRSQL